MWFISSEVRMRALLGLKTKELEELVSKMGLRPYHGRQLAAWIYRKRATSFQAMTDLPEEFRERLSQEYEVNPLQLKDLRRSPDGTGKYLFQLEDDELIEAVQIPHRDWETVCVSTQVGCPVGCVFCASGKDFVRNLKAGEIIGQVLLARMGERCNTVFMGIGEPLLNREELFPSLEVLNCEVGIGARNLTVSTVGIVEGIVELANLGMEVNLAVSLHAPDSGLRQRLIRAPVPPIADVFKAVGYFFQKTGRRVSFEYVLLAGVNDLPEHAQSLTGLLKSCDFRLHINLVPYNETHTGFKRSSPKRVREFRQHLEQQGMSVTVRKERGRGIEAACGQLRRKSLGSGLDLRQSRG